MSHYCPVNEIARVSGNGGVLEAEWKQAEALVVRLDLTRRSDREVLHSDVNTSVRRKIARYNNLTLHFEWSCGSIVFL